MAASILGLGQDDTYLIGSLIVAAFFTAAFLVLPREAPAGVAAIYGLVLCSPAVMLGVERGNVDIALFSMVAAAGLVMRTYTLWPARRIGADPGRRRLEALSDRGHWDAREAPP